MKQIKDNVNFSGTSNTLSYTGHEDYKNMKPR